MVQWFRRKNSEIVRNSLAFLLESQFWDASQIRQYQWQKLQHIIKFSFSNVPYYQSIFNRIKLHPDDITSPEVFALLPVLTKTDIQESLDDLVAKGIGSSALTLNSTGGSTGVPLNFYHDENYTHWADAARLRAWRYMVGVHENELEAVLWGAVRDIGAGITAKKMIYNLVREGSLVLNTFDLDLPMLKQYLKYYNLIKPSIVRGYASSLYYVACYLESEGVAIHRPKAVISTTEVLNRRMRDSIERVFGAKVFDSYGCREVSQIATECEAHDGLHVVFENQYVELVGNDIIITNLNSYGMPFIRYKVGDLASEIDWSACRCGRYSPRIKKLVGRSNDNIVLSNGKVINGEFFEFLFFGIHSVIQYQIIYRRSKDLLEVKLHVRDNLVDVGDIVKRCMRNNFNFINVAVIYDDKFDKTPTGKLRFVYTTD